MRIVVDLDGTICELKKGDQSYADVAPLPGAIESLRRLKSLDHEIVIYTARHMKSCDGNIGQVNRRIGKITLDWLEHYGVPYDEIVFGKPSGDVYIDDLGHRFTNWDQVYSVLAESESNK